MLRIDQEHYLLWDEEQFIIMRRELANRYDLWYFTTALGALSHLTEIRAGDKKLRNKIELACEQLKHRRRCKRSDLPSHLRIIDLNKDQEFCIEEVVPGRKTPLRWNIVLNATDLDGLVLELSIKAYQGNSFEQFLRSLGRYKAKQSAKTSPVKRSPEDHHSP